MIIRDYVLCETCEHAHTVRIGLGNDGYQPYQFPCKACGENISIALKLGTGLVLVENAVKGNAEGVVVNLDASFLSNPENVGVDHLVQRVTQARNYFIAQKNHYENKYGVDSFEKAITSQQTIQPILFSDEWKLLRKCWSLHQRDKGKLSRRVIDKENETIYAGDPLDDIYDWLWRFSSRLSGNVYDKHFEAVSSSIFAAVKDNEELKRFTDHLREKLFKNHLDIFFEIFKKFFQGYADFNQVYLYCSAGLEIPQGHQATSRDFDNVSAFYGNAFEAFTSLVETLACLNNVMAGRVFDQFETMDLKQYKKLDKANKCKSFSKNEVFSILCESVDSQLRNASHHGGFRFNQENGLIKFRAGKGGVGAEKEITYTDYLLKCTNLFLAIATLMRIELILYRHM